MFKLIVNGKNGREESDFTTEGEAQAHFDLYRSKGHWGSEEIVINHPAIEGVYIEHLEVPAVIIDHPEVPEVIAQDAVLDVNGDIVTPAIEAVAAISAWVEVVSEAIPAWTETISEPVEAWVETIPAQFTWEIVEFNPPLADISPRQIALALLSLGITESQVISSINQLPSPLKEQGVIAWNRSNYFVRTEPAVAMIGQLMGLSSEQLDQIWNLGITL